MASDSTTAEDNNFVALLLLLARRAPEPWYYQEHARQTGANPAALAELLEWLYLEGLVQRGPGTNESGPGIVLTPFGQQVAAEPELLDRLRRGEPLRERDVGATVRNSLLNDVTPVVTRALIALSVVVFAYGMYDPRNNATVFELGVANTGKIVAGQWWRLITSTFLHAGLMHIGFNMMALNSLGKFVEQTWGPWRMAVIYAVAAWTGSCFAAGYSPGVNTVGASGAICGLMGAEGMWVALYGRYLPRGFTKRMRSQFFINVVFLVFISLMPGISWQGHLGGAVGGAVVALLLHLNRFGPTAIRWPALLALPLVVWGSFAWMSNALSATMEGRAALREVADEGFVRPARNRAVAVLRICENKVSPLMEDFHPKRRPPAEVQAALEALASARGDAVSTLDAVRKARGQSDIKKAAAELLEASITLCDVTTKYLNKGEATKESDKKDVEKQFRKVDELENALEKWAGE